MDQGYVASFKQFFYEKGLTLTTEQIVALINNMLTGASAPAEAVVFSINNQSDKYEDVGANCVITHLGLVGKSGYPVSTTQLNVQFLPAPDDYDPDDDEVNVLYNSTDGKMTIRNFNLMDGEYITINSIGGAASSSFDTVLSRIELLEKLTNIIKLGTVMIWDVISPIPPGFVEVTDYTGRFMIGVDGTVTEFNTVGKTGGQSKFKLILDMLPKFRLFTIVNEQLIMNGHPGDVGRAVSAIRSVIRYFLKTDGGGAESTEMAGTAQPNVEPNLSPTSWGGKDPEDQTEINNLPPFRAVRYIRYAG